MPIAAFTSEGLLPEGDMLLAQEGQTEVAEAIAFFAQVRKRIDVRKGMLRIRP